MAVVRPRDERSSGDTLLRDIVRPGNEERSLTCLLQVLFNYLIFFIRGLGFKRSVWSNVINWGIFMVIRDKSSARKQCLLYKMMAIMIKIGGKSNGLSAINVILN